MLLYGINLRLSIFSSNSVLAPSRAAASALVAIAACKPLSAPVALLTSFASAEASAFSVIA
jgi:hypothetical protein|nr:MAG TPA: hypothetical protein [Caudoviricetes sp.]